MYIHYFSVILIVIGNCLCFGDYPSWVRYAGGLVAGIGYPLYIFRLEDLYEKLKTLERKLK